MTSNQETPNQSESTLKGINLSKKYNIDESYHSPPFSPAKTPQKVQVSVECLDPEKVEDSNQQYARNQLLSSHQNNNEFLSNHQVRKAYPLNVNQSTGGVNTHKKQNSKIIREKMQMQQKSQQNGKSINNSISQFSNGSSMAALGTNKSGMSSQFNTIRSQVLNTGVRSNHFNSIQQQIEDIQGATQNQQLNFKNDSGKKPAQIQYKHPFHFDNKQDNQQNSSMQMDQLEAPSIKPEILSRSANTGAKSMQFQNLHPQSEMFYSPFIIRKDQIEDIQNKYVVQNETIQNLDTLHQSNAITTIGQNNSNFSQNFESFQTQKNDHEMSYDTAKPWYQDKENVNLNNSDKTKIKHQNVIELIQEQKLNMNQVRSNSKENRQYSAINQIHKSLRKQGVKPHMSSPHFFLEASLGIRAGVQQPRVLNLKKNSEKKNLSVGNLFPKMIQSRRGSKQNESVQYLDNNKEYSRYYAEILNKSKQVGLSQFNTNQENNQENKNIKIFSQIIGEKQINNNELKKFNLDDQIFDQQNQPQEQVINRYSADSQNERNMQNIQCLQLGDTSSFEKQSEQRISDPENKQFLQIHNKNAMLLEDDDSSNQIQQFTKEREYNQQELEVHENGKPPAPLVLSLKLQNSESNTLMKINSCNENTSSSLGKRTFTKSRLENQKNSSAQKSQGNQLEQIDENETIEKRIKKTPARRIIKKGIQRTNSDNFCVEQVQMSGKKMLNDDNEESYNFQIENQQLNLTKVKSDMVMSSFDPGDNRSHDGSKISSSINFQKMCHNGQNNQQFHFFNNIQLKQHQFSGNGSSFDNQNGNHSHSGYEINQEGYAQNIDNGNMKQFKSNILINKIPKGKETPIFPKQQISNRDLINNFCKQQNENNQQQITFQQQEPSMLFEQRSNKKDSVESEEDQFERENEDQSTMMQTDLIRTEKKKCQTKKLEINQIVNNFGQVYMSGQQQQNNFMTSFQQFQLANSNKFLNCNDNKFQADQVKRHLSFKSVSNNSSLIETPVQYKRMKQESQNNSNNQENRIFNMQQRPADLNALFFPQPEEEYNQQDELASAPKPFMQQSFSIKENESPLSLAQRWRISDPQVTNKYSSGATPKQQQKNRFSKVTSSSIAQNFGEMTMPIRSKSHYFKQPANLTMPTRMQPKRSFNNEQQQFGGTLSPNGLRILSSDVSGVSEVENDNQLNWFEQQKQNFNNPQRKFQIEQKFEGKQLNMYEEQSDQFPNQLQNMSILKLGNSCNNLLTQSYPNPPTIMGNGNLDMQAAQAYYLNNNLSHTMNEKGQSGIKNSLLLGDNKLIMSPEIINRQQSDLQRMNSKKCQPQVLHQNCQKQQNVSSDPFVIASNQPQHPFNNFTFKTQSSVSNSQMNGKPNYNIAIPPKLSSGISDWKSNGGPKTPVHNNHGIFKRTSQISATNTSMNEQSMISSSIDTEGNQGYKKGYKRPQQYNISVNQFQYGGNGSNAGLGQNSLQGAEQQQQVQKPVSWLDKEFTRLGILGKGHFGQVLKCQNKTDNFEYAIKVTKHRIRNQSEQAYYLQEMQTLSALSVEAECPHIVRYFNSWIEDNRIHIVMELCEKSLKEVKMEAKKENKKKKQQIKNLSQDMFQGLIPEQYLRKIIRDILLGLHELHSQDIVHLDIKPGNILKGKNANYKLGDLGMARFLTKITEEINIPEGDSRYLAKELLSRDLLSLVPDLKKSDIFSLGITAYELITLEELAVNGTEWRELRDGTFEYPQEVLSLYSSEILNAIRRMLSENTDDRPCAEELLSTVFISQDQRRIKQLESDNQRLLENQQKLFDFLRQNGADPIKILQQS